MGAHDHAEHVVEVMGDAAGELAERLHFLGLPELVFGGFAPYRLLRKLLIGRRQPVVRGGECEKRLAGEAGDQKPHAADQKEGDGDADLQQRCGTLGG